MVRERKTRKWDARLREHDAFFVERFF